MSEQELDAQAAKDQRDEAIQRVGDANQDLKGRAIAAIRSVALERDRFTTDEVWMAIGREGSGGGEPRTIGAAMKDAKALKICVPTAEYQLSARARCHARPIRVWRSLLRPQEPSP